MELEEGGNSGCQTRCITKTYRVFFPAKLLSFFKIYVHLCKFTNKMLKSIKIFTVLLLEIFSISNGFYQSPLEQLSVMY